MDSHRRSFAKAFSWRLVAFVITFTVAYMVTGETHAAAGIGLVDSVIKIFAYYGHERIWFRIPFGKSESLEYEI